MNNIICCPVCRAPLILSAQNWHCQNGHQFDLAKQGYCNLLLANQKRSAAPGDNREMIQSRHSFLHAGYYQPVVHQLTKLVHNNLNDIHHIADIGCGDGYYTTSLQRSLSGQAQFYGIDISRDAIRIAARENPAVKWMVASSRHLPFMDHCLDLLMNIFAPASWPEFHRCLKPGAHVVLAVAGPYHLYELKQYIYTTPQLHQPSRFIESASPWFEPVLQQEISYQLELKRHSAVLQLLKMTPYYWKAGKQQQFVIENLQSLATTVNVQFFLMKATTYNKDIE